MFVTSQYHEVPSVLGEELRKGVRAEQVPDVTESAHSTALRLDLRQQDSLALACSGGNDV